MSTGIPNRVITIDKGQEQSWATQYVVASGAVGTIVTGTPAKCVTADGSVAGVVVPMVDGDGIVTAERFVGICKRTSTDTAAANGTVDTWAPVPGILYRGSPLVAGSCNTQAKLNALSGKKVIFDLTSSNWTVDTAASDALVNCLIICGGIPANDEVNFVYASKGTIFNSATSM